MIRLNAKDFPTLTFSPDDAVLAMVLDQNARRFVVGIEAAYIDPDVQLVGVRLELSAWSNLTLTAEVESQGHVTVDQLPSELSELCEFEMQPNGLIRVAGFLRQAHGWCEMTFQNPQMAVEYSMQQPLQRREHTP
ncbi:hypothetical protein [Deinococcus aquaticus]|uniref:hypothetical protein n=1 Tax=Deinococcus aquaticus TaxID=328692 RepID=UPI003F48E5EF